MMSISEDYSYKVSFQGAVSLEQWHWWVHFHNLLIKQENQILWFILCQKYWRTLKKGLFCFLKYVLTVFYQIKSCSAISLLIFYFSTLFMPSIWVIGRVLHVTSIARNDFLSSIQGEQTVRTHLQTENILQRLLKSMPKLLSRIFFWIPSSYVHFVINY